ncbi:putative lung seven transmembrane receptor [Hibiscus syriacus]|uniref:Lung seven transmembrane receptor n=1 Tax=Hibiscus syriacus TaxID=106335 RepID=A0A6A3BBZ4_HIBSY|nr:putative lung seven transmembrane receptor [Hibiscus syriacus]
MSWIRTVVSRAVEVGGKNTLRRTVWSVADSVVFGGARKIHNRIAARNMQNLRINVKRLEEVSVSCTGVERVQLLRRWLVALKEIDRLCNDQHDKKNIIHEDNNNNITKDDNNSDSCGTTANDNDRNNVDQFSYEEITDSTQKPTLVYYYDPEIGEPMNFREVFLYSQALEGMTLSMILVAPNEEEVSLFAEILRICIEGGKEVHETVMSSIMTLSVAFSNYQEEVLIQREELLQYAQTAIKGLKINVGLARIDAEACGLKEKLGELKELQSSSSEGQVEFSEKQTAAMIEALKEALGLIRLYSRLEALLLKKKSLSNGDTPELHAEKVDKLKVLSESLVNSTSKAEKRILEQRSLAMSATVSDMSMEYRVQKEAAVSFRIAKANEVNQQEKKLEAGILELEKRKDELEAELRKVNASLMAARVRLINAREEREQFDDASNQILSQLSSKEEEISKSIALCRVEADVVNAWIHFLEDTWALQTTYLEQKEKQGIVTNTDFSVLKQEMDATSPCFISNSGLMPTASIDYLSMLLQPVCVSDKGMGMRLEPDPTGSSRFFLNWVWIGSGFLKVMFRSGRIRFQSYILKEQLGPSLTRIRQLVENLASTETAKDQRRNLEEEYLSLESKFVSTFSVVGSMKTQIYSPNEGTYRKKDDKLKELFDYLESIREEFESIERPMLDLENPTQTLESPSTTKSPISPWSRLKSSLKKADHKKLKFELEQDDEESLEDETDEIVEWEYDAFEKDLIPN